MKKYSRILIVANLILLLGYFNWSVYQKEQTLKNGQLILLQLEPVDPRSLMQGDYMSLSYKESSAHAMYESNIPFAIQGYAIFQLDSNQVGTIIRLQEALMPIREGEIALKYKSRYNRPVFGAESFFFEEGQDTLYNKAMYGGLRVDKEGKSLLTGLYDKNYKLIQP